MYAYTWYSIKHDVCILEHVEAHVKAQGASSSNSSMVAIPGIEYSICKFFG